MSASAQKIHDRRWWTLAVLSTALLVISLDNTILNVALPTIERELDASSGQLQWVVDSYTLVFAGLLLTMGSLGDRFGRRRGLVIGLLVFGGGSVISAVARSRGGTAGPGRRGPLRRGADRPRLDDHRGARPRLDQRSDPRRLRRRGH